MRNPYRFRRHAEQEGRRRQPRPTPRRQSTRHAVVRLALQEV